MHLENTIHLNEVAQLFKDYFKESSTDIVILPPSGSDRIYFKVYNEKHTAIAAYNPDLKENRTFFYFTDLFNKLLLPVPELYHRGNNKGYYLLSFIEGPSLLDLIIKNGHSDENKALYKKCISNLVRFQLESREYIDYDMCYGASAFDQDQIFLDLMYFKYYFLDLHKVNYNKLQLHKEFEEFAKRMSAMEPKTFMYRDFQARNILINNDEPYFIDYQGGMKGLPQYDIVSLLWQAKAEIPDQWKIELFNHYFNEIVKYSNFINVNEIEFRRGYLDCIILRILQTLGAYGFRGLIEGKEHFLQSIYPALKQLKAFLDEYPGHPPYNELRNILDHIVKDEFMNHYNAFVKEKHRNSDILKVNVYSFSYKKGTAQDISGNGGGYMFDCRGILNPGRIDKYKELTGMDLSVQQYLEQETEMPKFIEHIKSILDITVKDYLDRGFTNLNISFGCTGGRHRSVYAAEKIFDYLKSQYKLTQINKLHLEQVDNDTKRINGGL